MDLATIIGFLGTIGMIAGAMISAGGLGSYIDVPSILIVFGGSFFAVMYCAILTLICFLLIDNPNLSFFVMVTLAILFIVLPMASFARSTTKKFLSLFK